MFCKRSLLPVLLVTLPFWLAGCGSTPPEATVEQPVTDTSTQTTDVQIPHPEPQRQDVIAEAEIRAPQPSHQLHEHDATRAALRKLASTDAVSRNHAGLARYAPVAPMYQDQGRERYEAFTPNGIILATQQPVSTFSIDVDTAAYANIRRMLNHGQWPETHAVRVEEMLNYFSYDYPKTDDPEQPFSVYTEVGPSPWDNNRRLLHVGINGWQPPQNAALPPTNLVFLIDVSGSMQAPNKMGLLKSAMKLLVKQMRPQDKLSIAVYAGASGQVLAPTPGNQQQKMLAALNGLSAGGSTNGEAGIHLAYQMANANFVDGGVNRVILATDGDFNVGTTDVDALEKLVERQRRSGVELTVLGFGTGNYNDHLMQKIAQVGNGNAAYIDTLSEARKVLVDELGATLRTIAKDVKIQIEFNPQVVEAYRLIGYETRHLNREDFNNDKVDAGEIGAGHTVTALYELSMVGGNDQWLDPLRYATSPNRSSTLSSSETELGYLKLRYKLPNAQRSTLVQQPLAVRDIKTTVQRTSDAFRFSAAVAWFGQILRNQDGLDAERFAALLALANGAKGQDAGGYRGEFVNLAKSAQALSLALGYDAQQSDNVARVN